ncbi:unnamed protein product [Meganyctiphanes norvegica]|uniref:Uncharacterized protein n=1 Tax=Meganyctiphanes norvegica TaxID=48144 RepID=A0AAV2RK52_MEGNR
MVRWMSTYHMIKQLILCKDRITIWLLNSETCKHTIGKHEWKVLENISTFLDPLEKVFKTFSQCDANASDILKYVSSLQKRYVQQNFQITGLRKPQVLRIKNARILPEI